MVLSTAAKLLDFVPLEKDFVVFVPRLTNITLLTLVEASSKRSRRPVSVTKIYTPEIPVIGECHTQLAKTNFDKIFDLTVLVLLVLYPEF